MDVPDEQLVARCQNELPYITDAFELLVRRYEPLVFRTCQRYLKDEDEAEEASQDAFLRAFHGLPKFHGHSTFRTWLFRIVANVCATRYARIQRRTRHHDELLEKASAGETGGMVADPERGDLSGPVADALDDLSDEDRQIIVLRHVSELTLEEIASALNLKLSAAKMRLYRAQQRFREIYGLPEEEGEKNLPPL